jgi:hypothetical protein
MYHHGTTLRYGPKLMYRYWNFPYANLGYIYKKINTQVIGKEEICGVNKFL